MRTTSWSAAVSAHLYARRSVANDAAGAAEHRRLLLQGLRGRVVEVGAGNGLNFAHYPVTVTEVIAVEPQPFLMGKAAQAAGHVAVEVAVVAGMGGALPLRTASCDAGVASLVLCSVESQHDVLAEFRRVIRPGGELRFYEHVLAEDGVWARRQRRADFLWSRVTGGCHLSKETLAAITDAGFEIEACERFLFQPNALSKLAAPHVLGRARR